METIIVCELKAGTNSWPSTLLYMNTRGQGHCLTFVQGNSDLNFQTSAPNLLDTSVKFHVEPLWSRDQICSNDVGNMTKMAAMPIYG